MPVQVQAWFWALALLQRPHAGLHSQGPEAGGCALKATCCCLAAPYSSSERAGLRMTVSGVTKGASSGWTTWAAAALSSTASSACAEWQCWGKLQLQQRQAAGPALPAISAP